MADEYIPGGGTSSCYKNRTPFLRYRHFSVSAGRNFFSRRAKSVVFILFLLIYTVCTQNAWIFRQRSWQRQG